MTGLRSAWKSMTDASSHNSVEAHFEHMTRVILLLLSAVSITAVIPVTIAVIALKIPFGILIIILIMAAVFPAGWFFSGLGWWRLCRHIPVILIFGAAFYGNYVGGTGSPSIIQYVVVITLSVMLYDTAGRTALIVLTLASFFLLGFLHDYGIISPIRVDETYQHYRMIMSGSILLSVAVLMLFLVSQLRGALNVSLSREYDLAAINEELQGAMEELEATNEEFQAQNEELISVNHELERSERRFNTLIESSPIPIVLIRDPSIIYANYSFRSMVREEPGKPVTGTSVLEYFAPEERPRITEFMSARLRDEKAPIQYESTGIRQDGTRIPYEVSVTRVKLSDGPITMAFVKDITDRVEAERNIRESEQKYRALVERINEVIFSIDKNGIITYISPAIASMTGFLPFEIIGTHFVQFINSEDIDIAVSGFNNMSEGVSSTVDYRLISRMGDPVWVRDYSTPIIENGNFAGVSGVLTDIHEQKLAELQVLESRKELERANEELTRTNRRLEDNEQALIQSKSWLQSIAETVPGVIYQFYARPTGEYGLYFVSQRIKEVFGIDNDDINTFFPRFTACVAPECRDDFLASIAKAVEDVSRWEFQGRFIRPDGAEMFFHGMSQPVATGNELVFSGVLLDITARVRSETVIKETMAILQHSQEVGKIGRWRLDLRTMIFTMSDMALELIGMPPGSNPSYEEGFKLAHPDDTDLIQKAVTQAIQTGEPFMIPYRIYRKDTGELRHIISRAEAERDLTGAVSALFGINQDVTEIRHIEDALRESEQKFRALFDSANDAILLMSRSGILDFNRKTLEMFGCDKDDLINASALAFTPELQPDGRPSSEAARERMTAAYEGNPQVFEWLYKRRDGTPFYAEVSLTNILVRGENLLQAIIRDITERKHAENEIIKLNQELELKVVERTSELRASNENLVASNRSLEAAIRKLGETQAQLVLSEKLAALGQLAAGIAHELNTPLGAIMSSNRSMLKIVDQITGLIAHVRSMSGQQARLFDILLKSSLSPTQIIDHVDRSVRKSLAGDLEASGFSDADQTAYQLADLGFRSVDEELRALMQVPERDLIIENVRAIASVRRLGDVINIAADKASHVVGALRSYLRQDESSATTTVDIPGELRTIFTLYHNRIKQGVELREDYSPHSTVQGDRDRLNQVWMNLINNALQAMDYRGTLAVRTTAADGWVTVSFTDTGHGIPGEIRDRIFEPFFTTKKHGEGIGLGLDICRRIIEGMGGRIELDSKPGETIFRVLLRQA